MISSFIKNKNQYKRYFMFFLIIFVPCICNAEYHTYQENKEFGLQCKNDKNCNLAYKKNNFIVQRNVSIEPSNIYFENNIYNIVYPCGTSCVDTVFFKAPDKVSNIYLNVLSTSPNGDYVAIAKNNEVLIYETFSGVLLKKQVISEVKNIIANYQDSSFQDRKMILIIQNNDGDDLTIDIGF